MKTTWKHAAALATLLIASAGPAFAGDRYDAAFTRTSVSITFDPECPISSIRFTSPHAVFDTLGIAVGTFTGCLDLTTPTVPRFLAGTVTFVYTDGATSAAACEEWSQVPIHACAAANDHEFRCTFTGGTGRLAGIGGFFDVRYFDYLEGTCGSPAVPDLIGYSRGHIQLH